MGKATQKGMEVKNLGELRATAEEFLRAFLRGRTPEEMHATVIGLSGDLGAGKTAFVKCVADILGIRETITSPTFILEKIYAIPRGSLVEGYFTKLIHIDAYRLHDGSEMHALEWKALLANPANIIFLEWPEHVASAMPKNFTKISFEYVDEKTRKIQFK